MIVNVPEIAKNKKPREQSLVKIIRLIQHVHFMCNDQFQPSSKVLNILNDEGKKELLSTYYKLDTNYSNSHFLARIGVVEKEGRKIKWIESKPTKDMCIKIYRHIAGYKDKKALEKKEILSASEPIVDKENSTPKTENEITIMDAARKSNIDEVLTNPKTPNKRLEINEKILSTLGSIRDNTSENNTVGYLLIETIGNLNNKIGKLNDKIEQMEQWMETIPHE